MILNSSVMMLRRGYIARSLRIKSILCVLCVDGLDCIRGIWSLDERLRADCTRLNHCLVEVLWSLVHTRTLGEVVWILLQLLFSFIDGCCLVHLRRHLTSNIAFFSRWWQPSWILLSNTVVPHGLDWVLARPGHFGGLNIGVLDDLPTVGHLH